MASIEKLTARVEALEANLGKTKPPKVSKPRKPSEYNKFMQKFIKEQRKKNPDKPHSELFAEGAKAWGAQKEK